MKNMVIEIPVVAAKYEMATTNQFHFKNLDYHFHDVKDFRHNICKKIFIAKQSKANYVIASAVWKEKKKVVADPVFTKSGKIKRGTENRTKVIPAQWRRNFYEITPSVVEHFGIVEIINDMRKGTIMKLKDGRVLNHKFQEIKLDKFGRPVKK